MQIQYKTSIMHLDELPLDIGYASEKVVIVDTNNKKHTIGGHTGKTQLIITLPFIDNDIKDELKSIVNNFPEVKNELTTSIIVANSKHISPSIPDFNFYIDEDNEFADYYGVKLVGKPFDAEFTKAVILISKDGAIFYDEFLEDINEKFNRSILERKILAAQECYTGKGCH